MYGSGIRAILGAYSLGASENERDEMTDWRGWSQIGLGTPATYRIVVRGSLERSWSEQLGGLNICTAGEVQDPQLTILTGRLPDQAALLGVLDRLYGLGFALLSVESLMEAKS